MAEPFIVLIYVTKKKAVNRYQSSILASNTMMGNPLLTNAVWAPGHHDFGADPTGSLLHAGKLTSLEVG
jgi:hypothetical protein